LALILALAAIQAQPLPGSTQPGAGSPPGLATRAPREERKIVTAHPEHPRGLWAGVWPTLAKAARTRGGRSRAMDELLQTLEPKAIWKYFLELSAIPRGSGHEAAAVQWVLEQARALGCEASADAAGNVLIRKPAAPGREGAAGVALQAHVDMVWEKNEGTAHEFLTDPIAVVREGDLLRAKGTTLGADDGIGVAAALAVLASEDIPHGPLEVLITTGEEVGLLGARKLAPGILRAQYLLNLDSGKAGFVTIGCSGGLDSGATREVATVPAGAGLAAFRIKVSGLKGGHSGGDINQGRGNAIRILAQALASLGPAFGLELAELNGGDKRNAIPREAAARVFLDPAREAELRTALGARQEELRASFGSFDPGVALALERSADPDRAVLAEPDARAVLAFLLTVPHGVVANSPVLPGLVQTSSNLARVNTRPGQVEVIMSHRSSLVADKTAVADQVAALCALAGFRHHRGEGYPGWQPDPASPLARKVSGVYEGLFGRPMEYRATHGGLECGLIGQGHPGLQMVSFGPDMWDIHTPEERLSISSAAAFWRLLGAVLEAL
jgi:dipeptidase D